MQENVIEIVPYKQGWIDRFQSKSKVLSSVLGKNCKAIHPIGSTVIPSLASKPTIDRMVEVYDISQIDACSTHMIFTGYEPADEYGVPFRRYFIKKTRNLHTIFIFLDWSTLKLSLYCNFVSVYVKIHPS